MKNKKTMMVTVVISVLLLVFTACAPRENINTTTPTPELKQQVAPQPEENLEKLNENIEFTGNAYNFELRDLEGNTHKLSDYAGKKVYIKFWSTWCSICIKGMPDFIQFVDQNKDNQNLVILTIVSPGVGGEMDEARFKDWYQKQGMNFNVLLDDNGNVMREYGIRGFPTSVFIDKNGNVFKENIGHMDNAAIDETINQMQ